MNKIYIKDLTVFSIFIAAFAFAANLLFGSKTNFFPSNWAVIALIILGLIEHVYYFYKLNRLRPSLKISIWTGFLSGISLTLAAKIGVIVSYLLMSSNVTLQKSLSILSEFWLIYLLMGLFGSICMSVEPFFRIVLHKELLKNNPSPRTM